MAFRRSVHTTELVPNEFHPHLLRNARRLTSLDERVPHRIGGVSRVRDLQLDPDDSIGALGDRRTPESVLIRLELAKELLRAAAVPLLYERDASGLDQDRVERDHAPSGRGLDPTRIVHHGVLGWPAVRLVIVIQVTQDVQMRPAVIAHVQVVGPQLGQLVRPRAGRQQG